MVTNNLDVSLIDRLNENIKWANEITICVAFFKMSGFRKLLPKLKKKDVRIITSRNFFQTEPLALLNAFKAGFEVYFQNEDSEIIFHPKVYLFKKKGKYRAIIGSSNLTNGGLVSNIEFSVELGSRSNQNEIKEVVSFLERVTKFDDFNKIISPLQIENYKIKFDKYNKHVSKSKASSLKSANAIHNLNIKELQDFLVENKGWINDFMEEKNEVYSEVKRILNKILDSKYSNKIAFMKDYQLVLNRFYSSGLNRGKSIFSENYKLIIQAIRISKDAKNIKQYELAIETVDRIPKMGVNAITEILNTYKPKIFPVLNNRSLSVLRNLGLIKNKMANAYTFEDYLHFTEIMKQIKKDCGLKDFREADFAFSQYYENVIK